MKSYASSEISLDPSKASPRYNSYPLLPYWKNDLGAKEWFLSCSQSLKKEDPKIAIYIHIPFCESLCSYCACSTYITAKNPSIEENYLELIHKEFSLYCQKVPEIHQSSLTQLYLGGGSPNFFSPQNLDRLLRPILASFHIPKEREFSCEADVRHLESGHLEALYSLGFRQLTLGIEDFDPRVQRSVNRIQSPKQVSFACETARKIGYSSIAFDLIYGLPHQSQASIRKSMQKVLEYRPERLAYYSYIALPQAQNIPRLLNEEDFPQLQEKRKLYECGHKILLKAGYQNLGMSHYVLESHPLWQAKKRRSLHRYFTDYSSYTTDLLLGLGSSAVSESLDSYHQNEKIFHKYQKQIRANRIATCKNHRLDQDDLHRRQIIRELCTQWQAQTFLKSPSPFSEKILRKIFAEAHAKLTIMKEAAFIEYDRKSLRILDRALNSLANICAVFDGYLYKD